MKRLTALILASFITAAVLSPSTWAAQLHGLQIEPGNNKIEVVLNIDKSQPFRVLTASPTELEIILPKATLPEAFVNGGLPPIYNAKTGITADVTEINEGVLVDLVESQPIKMPIEIHVRPQTILTATAPSSRLILSKHHVAASTTVKQSSKVKSPPTHSTAIAHQPAPAKSPVLSNAPVKVASAATTASSHEIIAAAPAKSSLAVQKSTEKPKHKPSTTVAPVVKVPATSIQHHTTIAMAPSVTQKPVSTASKSTHKPIKTKPEVIASSVPTAKPTVKTELVAPKPEPTVESDSPKMASTESTQSTTSPVTTSPEFQEQTVPKIHDNDGYTMLSEAARQNREQTASSPLAIRHYQYGRLHPNHTSLFSQGLFRLLYLSAGLIGGILLVSLLLTALVKRFTRKPDVFLSDDMAPEADYFDNEPTHTNSTLQHGALETFTDYVATRPSYVPQSQPVSKPIPEPAPVITPIIAAEAPPIKTIEVPNKPPVSEPLPLKQAIQPQQPAPNTRGWLPNPVLFQPAQNVSDAVQSTLGSKASPFVSAPFRLAQKSAPTTGGPKVRPATPNANSRVNQFSGRV